MSSVSNEIKIIIETSIIRVDVESIFSLMETERDPIFCLSIIPYYALFVQECQNYIGEVLIEEPYVNKTKDIRNFIKVYGERFGRTKKRIEKVDDYQNEVYKSQLKFDFMKDWNIHSNLGTFWTSDKHLIGNTQMFTDYLDIKNPFSENCKDAQFEFAKQLGSFISSIRNGFSQVISSPEIVRTQSGVQIEYYCDLNTNKDNKQFFTTQNKTLNLFYLNLLCSLNFVKYILRPLFSDENIWLFRIEYVVTYYTYKSFQRLKNHCDYDEKLKLDLQEFMNELNQYSDIFKSTFRNCMMHYKIENQNVLLIEDIEKPFFGIVESYYGNSMNYYSLLNKLRDLMDKMIFFLEDKFNLENIVLEKL